MKANLEDINSWMAGKQVGNSKYRLNENIKIISGEHIRKEGSVISLESVGENPSYIVELQSGDDVLVNQTDIESKNT